MDETITETTVQTLAEEAAGCFEGRTFNEGTDDEQRIRVLKDDRPEWVYELAREAHGDFFPDDWRYNCIEDALNFIAESDDPQDGFGEFADSAVDVYNGARVAWLESSIYRGAYCDEAAEEYGYDTDGGVYQLIGMGQYHEANEVYGLVLGCLESRLEEVEAEADTD